MHIRIGIAHFWVLLAYFASFSATLKSAAIDCPTSPCALGSGWTATFGANVRLLGVEVLADGQIQLTKEITFMNLNSVSVQFLGPLLTDPTDGSPQTFFRVTEKIINQTPADWYAFKFSIVDRNDVDPSIGGMTHPRKAHFHFGAFTMTDKLNLPPKFDDNDSGAFVGTATGGTVVGRTQTWNASTLRMHDRVDPDPNNQGKFLRMGFDLVEQPSVPEPATFAMMVGGIAALFGCRHLLALRKNCG